MGSSTMGSASIPFMGCGCLLLAIILHILAFASPHWASDDKGDFGLWKYSKCIPTRTGPLREQGCYHLQKSPEHKDWLDAVRGLESLAIIFWSIPIVVVPIYLYVALGLNYVCIMVSMTLMNLLGTICNIVGVVIFAIKIDDKSEWDWEWCLIVAGVGGFLGIVAFIIFAVACCNRPIFSLQTHHMSGFYVDPDRNKLYVVENVEETKPGPLEAGHVNPAMAQ